MIFNPDLPRKLNKLVHPNLTYNSHVIESLKHLGLILDNKLNFNECLKGVLDKISKTIGFIRKFLPILPRISLHTIHKTFVRPHLDYGDLIHDQTYNPSFYRKHESVQYSACLVITYTIRGTSYEKLNQELVWRLSNLDDGLGSYVWSTFLNFQ